MSNPIVKLKDGLQNLVSGLGTSKDKRMYSNFVRCVYTAAELEAMYSNDWLAGKIIDVPVDDMTREWRSLKSNELDPEQIDQVVEVEDKLKISEAFNECEKWARLYGGAVIVMGIDGAGEPDEPLEVEQVKEGALQFIHVVDRYNVSVVEMNTSDPTKGNFFQPEMYRVGQQNIHYSRVLRFEGLPMPRNIKVQDSYWGLPVLQRVYDAVLNAANAAQSTASLIEEANVDVIEMEDLFHKITQPGEEAAVKSRFSQFNLMKSNFGLAIIDKGKETYSKREATFTALPELITKFLNIAAAAADIPATRLLGESAPGLNATGAENTKHYYDMVKSRQRTEFNAQLDKLDQVMVRSALGVYPGDWSFEWNPLWQMSATEQAAVELSNAQRDQIYDGLGAIPTSVITAELKEQGVYDGLSNELVEAMGALELDTFEETPVASDNVVPIASASGAPAEDVQKQALNGAQIASMVEIAAKVKAGELDAASGVAILMVSIPGISERDARAAVGG